MTYGFDKEVIVTEYKVNFNMLKIFLDNRCRGICPSFIMQVRKTI